MKIKYPGKKVLKKKTKAFWTEVARKFNHGMPMEEIQRTYINKRTGKPYHRVHIYKMFNQLNKESEDTKL